MLVNVQFAAALSCLYASSPVAALGTARLGAALIGAMMIDQLPTSVTRDVDAGGASYRVESERGNTFVCADGVHEQVAGRLVRGVDEGQSEVRRPGVLGGEDARFGARRDGSGSSTQTSGV